MKSFIFPIMIKYIQEEVVEKVYLCSKWSKIVKPLTGLGKMYKTLMWEPWSSGYG